MIPSHEFFFPRILQGFAQGDHVVDDGVVVGNDASFESLDGEGKDVGDDEGGGVRAGSA